MPSAGREISRRRLDEERARRDNHHEDQGGAETGDRAPRDAPWQEPPEEIYTLTKSPAECPDEPAYVEIEFERGVPSAIKTFNWLGTIHGGRVRFQTPMLFAIGFVSLFVSGGLSGPFLAQPVLDIPLHDTAFVVGHFHLIMGVAAIFGMFAGTYYWFPKMFGRLMNERWGRVHFFFTLIGTYCIFMPMHYLGMAGQPRRYSWRRRTASRRSSTWAMAQLRCVSLPQTYSKTLLVSPGFKLRMAFEQLNEALADDAGRSENANSKTFSHGKFHKSRDGVTAICVSRGSVIASLN